MSGCLVIGAPRTRGVTFDGTNDSMARSSALSGAAAGDEGICSFWVKFDATTQLQILQWVHGGSVSAMHIFRSASPGNQIGFQFNRTAAPTLLGTLSSASGYTSADGWIHVLASWDISQAASAWKLYVDDADDTSATKDRNGNIPYDGADIYFARTSGGGFLFDGDIADFWLAPTYMDLTDSANRRKFISATGQPVYLGSTGERPTGSAPLIFLRGPASGFHLNRAGTGDFTLTGTLTNSATNPP
jgi:hypothetical protein